MLYNLVCFILCYVLLFWFVNIVMETQNPLNERNCHIVYTCYNYFSGYIPNDRHQQTSRHYNDFFGAKRKLSLSYMLSK